MSQTNEIINKILLRVIEYIFSRKLLCSFILTLLTVQYSTVRKKTRDSPWICIVACSLSSPLRLFYLSLIHSFPLSTHSPRKNWVFNKFFFKVLFHLAVFFSFLPVAELIIYSHESDLYKKEFSFPSKGIIKVGTLLSS